MTPDPAVVLDGLSFPESTRWHDGRLWLCDWAARTILAVAPDGEAEPIARVESFPFSIDWLPDGRLLVVSAADRAVLSVDADGTLSRWADLSGLGPFPPGNEIVIDALGRVYVNGGGFDPRAGGAPAPGTIALVSEGAARTVADGIAFGNGMAITPDGATLIVAESHACRLSAFDIDPDGGLSGRRVWAALGEDPPDGICIDAERAVWYADVPHGHCVRVAEGGEVLQRVTADRGCFACMLGGPQRSSLYIAARQWHGMAALERGAGSGRLLVCEVEVPGAGYPAA